MSILNKKILKLNAGWHSFSTVSVRDAIVMLCPEKNGDEAGFAMDFETIYDDDGNALLEYANPTKWEDWINLPIRDHDLVINTSRGQIRCPLVVICANYDKIPYELPKLGKDAILRRDNYTCQYTGQKLSRDQLNIDHVIPQDRGGKDSWENLVTSRKDINFSKGNRLNHEIGLKLIRQPTSPKPVPKIVRPDELGEDIRQQLMPFMIV